MSYIDYSVEIRSLNFDSKFKIESIYDGIKKIIIFQKNDNKDTWIRFFIEEKIVEPEIARKLTKKAMENILNKIAFNTANYIGIPMIRSEITKKSSKGYGKIKSVRTLCKKTDSQKLNEIFNCLEKNYEKESFYFELYRSALQIKNEIARFLFLYSILFDLINSDKKKSSQGNVDDFIRNQNKNVKEKKTTRFNKEYLETIYTYYRNQVSHTNENSNIKEIKNKITNLVDKLSKLVKVAIKRKNLV